MNEKLIEFIYFIYLLVQFIEGCEPCLAEDIIQCPHLFLIGNDLHEAAYGVVVRVPPFKNMKNN